MARLRAVEDIGSRSFKLEDYAFAISGLDIANLFLPPHKGQTVGEPSSIGNSNLKFSLRNLDLGGLEGELVRRYPNLFRLLGKSRWEDGKKSSDEEKAANSLSSLRNSSPYRD